MRARICVTGLLIEIILLHLENIRIKIKTKISIRVFISMSPTFKLTNDDFLCITTNVITNWRLIINHVLLFTMNMFYSKSSLERLLRLKNLSGQKL